MNESKTLIRSCCEDISHLEQINKKLPSCDEILFLSTILKAIADPTRLKILLALLEYEICVGEMVNILKLPQTNVSHQLKILREKGLVSFKKDKKMSFYYICNDEIKDLLIDVLKINKV
ncbi:MAG: winged helix-turn-helix transcriptional regulator [Campylobacteraceae bacterium]|nr:winged helix-turn-helix transcriptional regulator [Campylobacteraceae bacterium]